MEARQATIGIIIFAVAVLAGLSGAFFNSQRGKGTLPGETSSSALPAINSNGVMKLTSTAFSQGGSIPSRYTCDGENVNPPLAISGAPNKAKTLVLIMEDPDVPTTIRPDGIFDHWLIWNIPPGTTALAEATKPPGVEGSNTGGSLGYTGPCPPDREHRYFFHLYALDTTIDLPAGARKEELLPRMEGHVLEEAELLGHYARQNGS